MVNTIAINKIVCTKYHYIYVGHSVDAPERIVGLARLMVCQNHNFSMKNGSDVTIPNFLLRVNYDRSVRYKFIQIYVIYH